MDTEASIQQTIELADAGCEIVRITAPTVKDARNLEHIVKGLRERRGNVPIVADIHFKPEAAMEAAKWVDKVRINPGNYADSKKFVIREYTDEQYGAELARIRERFSPLVDLCKKRRIAMRIGTNHGSLSDRILNRYGDTPLGMVESALEFARIARDLDYHDFIFSMKASNPKIMIAAYRLLVARLNELGPDWNYPLHLGVTGAACPPWPRRRRMTLAGRLNSVAQNQFASSLGKRTSTRLLTRSTGWAITSRRSSIKTRVSRKLIRVMKVRLRS